MRLTTMLTTAWLGLTAALLPQIAPAAETGLFSPAITVNGAPITGYELNQRAKFLALLNAPGDLDKLARKQLIDDRIELQAAKEVGIVPTTEGVDAGMKEFAARANMTTDQFIQAIEQEGVSAQTFRDFVRAGIAWRSLVQQMFGPEIHVNKADIDRSLSLAAQQGELRLLLSEIVLPENAQQPGQTEALARHLSQTIRTPAQFAAAARQYSASSSAQRGGRIDWVPLSNLPPQIGDMLKGLKPGQVSPPVKMQGAVGLFLLRGVGEMTNRRPPAKVSVKYAELLIPGGHDTKAMAEAARINARYSGCDDLYAVAKGKPEGTLTFTTTTMNKVPTAIGLQLATLDAGEVSTQLTRGDNLVYLMLCYRRPVEAADPDLNAVGQQLFNQRLSGKAETYLARLRAAADIREP